MKFIRYAKGSTQYRGILDGNIIKRINGTIFHDYSLAAETINLSDVQILPPILPSKIIGFRKNYNGRKEDMAQPKIFMKPQSSIIAHNENIILPKNEKSVRIEGELALIIGKKAKNVSECHAAEHIFGYTIANDITAPQTEQDLTVTVGKCYDTFTPLGPCMVTDIDVSNIMINTYKNGQLVQSGSTASMIFDIYYQISYLSHIMTLNPGDIILTGTPSSAVEVQHNDVIEITIENIGTLTNKCINE
ncbi:MAG: fumarylacetoacetate hydrolase family protein [Candidatus Mucispirillum faecigallinarum]|nr:fumarylacetoacetate hydrolase family protein [Candidatus Mucispirillum faecigallinarum]